MLGGFAPFLLNEIMPVLKKKYIGQKTMSKLLNKMVVISDGIADILYSEGRLELFELPKRKALKPVEKKSKKKEEDSPEKD